jgi:hypothetical protein
VLYFVIPLVRSAILLAIKAMNNWSVYRDHKFPTRFSIEIEFQCVAIISFAIERVLMPFLRT